MPVDYSQNGKAQNARFLARELDQETTAARQARELGSEDYSTNGDSRPADDGICGGR
jgi:hypothetical protein